MAKTDLKTLELIQQINKQKKEIEKLEKPNWLTNCSFSYTEGKFLNDAVNIRAGQSLDKLAKIAGFLLAQEEMFIKGSAVLGIDEPFSWQGFTIRDWLSDIKLQAAKTQINSKKSKLEKLEIRLNALISPELKAEMELAEIMKELE